MTQTIFFNSAEVFTFALFVNDQRIGLLEKFEGCSPLLDMYNLEFTVAEETPIVLTPGVHCRCVVKQELTDPRAQAIVSSFAADTPPGIVADALEDEGYDRDCNERLHEMSYRGVITDVVRRAVSPNAVSTTLRLMKVATYITATAI